MVSKEDKLRQLPSGRLPFVVDSRVPKPIGDFVNAGTGPVNPSAPHALTEQPYAGTTSGRGNPHGPTINLAPRVPYGNIPGPHQQTGGNLTEAPLPTEPKPPEPTGTTLEPTNPHESLKLPKKGPLD